MDSCCPPSVVAPDLPVPVTAVTVGGMYAVVAVEGAEVWPHTSSVHRKPAPAPGAVEHTTWLCALTGALVHDTAA